MLVKVLLFRNVFVNNIAFCSITTENGEGFEAFFTTSGTLVIAVIIKKKYHSLSVTDHVISDSHWHCVDVAHTCAKGPFRKSNVIVYIDGRRVMTSDLDFPTNKDVNTTL